MALRPRRGTRVDLAARGITLGPRGGVPVRVARQAGTFEAAEPRAGSIRDLVRFRGEPRGALGGAG